MPSPAARDDRDWQRQWSGKPKSLARRQTGNFHWACTAHRTTSHMSLTQNWSCSESRMVQGYTDLDGLHSLHYVHAQFMITMALCIRASIHTCMHNGVHFYTRKWTSELCILNCTCARYSWATFWLTVHVLPQSVHLVHCLHKMNALRLHNML